MKEEEEDYRDYDERTGCAIPTAFVWIALVALCAAFWAICFTGCTTTKYVPVETVRKEYKDKVREVHTTDSVMDTRFVYVRGDTVIDYRDRIKWRDRIIRDTVSVELTDTVREPYPVERELSRWEQAKMDFGGMAIGGSAIALCIAVVWLARNLKLRIKN